jgi:hypothetical protein
LEVRHAIKKYEILPASYGIAEVYSKLSSSS